MNLTLGMTALLTIAFAVSVTGASAAEQPTADKSSTNLSAADQQAAAARMASVKLIEQALSSVKAKKDSAAQLKLLQRTSETLLTAHPNNVLLAEQLQSALQMAARATDPKEAKKAASALQDALRAASELLAFEVKDEAPLPENFPRPTPLGEIEIKQYPAYRLARTPSEDNSGFFTLFNHITSKEIAMTSPVEMTFRDPRPGDKKPGLFARGDDPAPREVSMGFMYRSIRQGETGQDKKVEVVDVPAMTVLSFGGRGDGEGEALAEIKARLDAWLIKNKAQYEVAGPLRVMGYNSPMIAKKKRFIEVQIPIRDINPKK